jgi:hypothetical protein
MRAKIRPSCPIALLIAAALLVALSAFRELWNADFAVGLTTRQTLRRRALLGHGRMGLQVATKPAPGFHVMDLQVFHRTAFLTAPTVSL